MDITESITLDEIMLIIESLNYTKKNINEYAYYPSYDYQLERLKEVDTLLDKLRRWRDERTD